MSAADRRSTTDTSSVADCAFELGERADSQGKLLDAALWFAEAARADSVSPIGRRASLRAAEAQLAQGDTIAAAIAFQSVLSAGTADSAGQVATARLQEIGFAAAGGPPASPPVQP